MALVSDIQGRSGVKYLRPQLYAAMGVVGVAFLALAVRLYGLQILRGDELARKGQRNFVQRVKVAHDRGIVYDRYGRILVDNRPSLNVQATPAFLGKASESQATLEKLAELVGLDPENFQAVKSKIEGRRGLDRFKPVLVKRDLSPELVEAVEAARSMMMLDGVDIVEGRRRTYRFGKLAAHLLGYVNEIDPGTLRQERDRGNPLRYELGDVIGRDGVERMHEEALRGTDGYEKTVVDAKGRRQQGAGIEQLLGEHRKAAPQPGHNLFLTLDLDLQQAAERALTGRARAGAVVALDPTSGAVLALASHPAYDPNLVTGVLAKDEKKRLDVDELKPWVNRAIQGQYAPGSTFKVVTALAALKERATSLRDQIWCPGFFRMGRQVWRCHKDAGHGLVGLKEAMKVSCDTYFYTMGGRVGIDAIASVARELGLGRPTGIRIPGEQPGLVPDTAFHDRVDRATGGYQRGMAVNTSIGQGSVLVTPLQMAVAYAAIANQGTVMRPRLVHRVETADFRVVRRYLPETRLALSSDDKRAGMATAETLSGSVIEEVEGQPPRVTASFTAEPRASVTLARTSLIAVHRGLVAVASEPGGTAYYRRSRVVPMAGKTGTAQVVRLGRERLDADEMAYLERDHAWFVAYAPPREPKIVVAALNEHSGHGSSKAAPIAVEVIDAFFALDARRSRRASVGGSGGGP